MRRSCAGSPRPLFHPQSRDTGRRHLQSRDTARGVLELEATTEKCMSGSFCTPRGGVGCLPAVRSFPAIFRATYFRMYPMRRPWSACRAVTAVAGGQAAAAVVPRSAVAPGSTVVMEGLATTAVAGDGTVADHGRFHRARDGVLEQNLHHTTAVADSVEIKGSGPPS